MHAEQLPVQKILNCWGYANVFPGFNQYMRSLGKWIVAQNLEKQLNHTYGLKDYAQSLEQEKDSYQRMDYST